MFTDPAATPCTTPPELTVAVPVADELHEPPVPVVLNVVLAPVQTEVAPEIVPALGNARTVSARVATSVPQLLVTE